MSGSSLGADFFLVDFLVAVDAAFLSAAVFCRFLASGAWFANLAIAGSSVLLRFGYGGFSFRWSHSRWWKSDKQAGRTASDVFDLSVVL